MSLGPSTEAIQGPGCFVHRVGDEHTAYRNQSSPDPNQAPTTLATLGIRTPLWTLSSTRTLPSHCAQGSCRAAGVCGDTHDRQTRRLLGTKIGRRPRHQESMVGPPTTRRPRRNVSADDFHPRTRSVECSQSLRPNSCVEGPLWIMRASCAPPCSCRSPLTRKARANG
jgi:hypothetical protein